MKKIIVYLFVLLSIDNYSQNTIPTTTCTGALKINDSLNVNKDITALGDIISKGEVTSTDTLRAKEDVIASKDIKVEGSVYVNHDITVDGKLTAKSGITFDGNNGLFRTAATATTGEIIKLGSNAAKPLPFFYCQDPSSEPWNQFYYNGNFVSYLPSGSNISAPLVDAAVRIGIAPWNGNGVIDVSGVDNSGAGNNGLEINTFCKRNTYINMGWDVANGINGGRVFMGAEVDMARSLKIGYSGTSIVDPNCSIEINQNVANAKGVNVKTYDASIKAFAVERLDGKNNFVVYGDGKTQIGQGKPKVGGSAANAMLSVDGLILAKEVKVAIANTHWADYVFEKEYKLMPLKDVEEYIGKNKHLPEVPNSNEVEKNGVDLIEMNATLLKKIEELTLYLIEQNKRIEKMEKENAILNKKNK